jgi:hypothetical protein
VLGRGQQLEPPQHRSAATQHAKVGLLRARSARNRPTLKTQRAANEFVQHEVSCAARNLAKSYQQAKTSTVKVITRTPLAQNPHLV